MVTNDSTRPNELDSMRQDSSIHLQTFQAVEEKYSTQINESFPARPHTSIAIAIILFTCAECTVSTLNNGARRATSSKRKAT